MGCIIIFIIFFIFILIVGNLIIRARYIGSHCLSDEFSRSAVTFVSVLVLSGGCGYSDTLQTVTEFLKSPTDAKSCLLLNEGCGGSQPLFAPMLDPDCGIENAGRPVEIKGLFAVRLNVLQQTYFPTPIDKWKAMAVTDYGFAEIETVIEEDRLMYRMRRQYCMKYLTKVLGIEYVFDKAIFENLSPLQFYTLPYPDSLLIGQMLTFSQTWLTMGLSADFDIFTDKLPSSASNAFVIDEDRDGHPGITVKLKSSLEFISGDYYMVTATSQDEELTICSEHQLQGYILNGRTNQNTLGNNATYSFSGSTDIEFRPGSTALYVKIGDSETTLDHEYICSYILKEKDTLFGSSGDDQPIEELTAE